MTRYQTNNKVSGRSGKNVSEGVGNNTINELASKDPADKIFMSVICEGDLKR